MPNRREKGRRRPSDTVRQLAPGLIAGASDLASSFVAVPVPAATTGSVVCQQFGWAFGAQRAAPPGAALLRRDGRIAAGRGGVLPGGLPPISLLFLASIAGLATPVGLVFLLLVARDRAAMRGMPISGRLAALGRATTAVVTGSGMLFLWTQLRA